MEQRNYELISTIQISLGVLPGIVASVNTDPTYVFSEVPVSILKKKKQNNFSTKLAFSNLSTCPH